MTEEIVLDIANILCYLYKEKLDCYQIYSIQEIITPVVGCKKML